MGTFSAIYHMAFFYGYYCIDVYDMDQTNARIRGTRRLYSLHTEGPEEISGVPFYPCNMLFTGVLQERLGHKISA